VPAADAQRAPEGRGGGERKGREGDAHKGKKGDAHRGKEDDDHRGKEGDDRRKGRPGAGPGHPFTGGTFFGL